MKASLHSVRIAPKKANLVAAMIRGQNVGEALDILRHTNKKAARLLEELLKSAIANARQNEKQDPSALVVKTLVVNKAQALHRGVPMARGRIRPMRKFLSHITLTLGVQQAEEAVSQAQSKKTDKAASQEPKKQVKSSQSAAKTTTKPSTASKSSKGTSAKAETTASDSKSAASAKDTSSSSK